MLWLVKCVDVDSSPVLLTVEISRSFSLGKYYIFNKDFEQAIQNSLRDVSHIPWLKEKQKIYLWSGAKS